MESPDQPELTVPESFLKPAALDEEREKDDNEYWPEYCNPHYQMPDRIDIKIVVPNGEPYFFPVSIIKSQFNKRFLGGYRNKLNGKIYHHASTQTPTDQKGVMKDYTNLRTRETQTYELRTLGIQPYRESGTQMERIDVRLDNKRDVFIVPRPYFTSDELLMVKKGAVILIQRVWRGYLARVLANQIRQRNVEFAKLQESQREEEVKILKAQRVKEMAKRIHPKNNSDFAELYNELDVWRKTEANKIKTTMSDPEERRVAMAALLENEVKALHSMQALKVAARKEVTNEKTQQMLEMMAKPHVWQLSHGEVAQVQTLATLRAKELLDLFNAMNSNGTLLSIDQRLDVLLNIKWTVNEFDTALTREIKELVDREADLLNRGRPMRSMEALRMRLKTAFLQFLEDPLYNPRAMDFVKKSRPLSDAVAASSSTSVGGDGEMSIGRK